MTRNPDRPGSGRLVRAGLALLALAVGGYLASCRPFDVNVATPEPVQVDVTMDVHVYQHGSADSEEKKEEMAGYKKTMQNRRNRMGEIQELKNNRLVGESRLGTLEIRSVPAGDYGNYVRETVAAENRDREFLMQHEAREKDVPLADVRAEQWRHWQRKSFPGEWIEVAEDDAPGAFRWIQKPEAE